MVIQCVASTKSLIIESFLAGKWNLFYWAEKHAMQTHYVLQIFITKTLVFQHLRGKPGWLHCLLALVVHGIILQTQSLHCLRKGVLFVYQVSKHQGSEENPGTKGVTLCSRRDDIIWKSFAQGRNRREKTSVDSWEACQAKQELQLIARTC